MGASTLASFSPLPISIIIREKNRLLSAIILDLALSWWSGNQALVMQSESEDPFLKWKYFIEGFLPLHLYNKRDDVGDFTKQDWLALQGLLQSSSPPDLKCNFGYLPPPSASSSQHISSVPIRGVKSPMVLRPQRQNFHSGLRNLN